MTLLFVSKVSTSSSWHHFLTIYKIIGLLTFQSLAEVIPSPSFVGPVNNVTVALGREAVITCTVDNLGSYKVAWVRVDTQTILTIHTHVITRSNRISLSHTDSWTWNLLIKSVRESDRSWYMCQINTDPMMSQNGYLQVVVPPDILDYPTSPDMVVREGATVSLQCAATGFPPPKITWRREDKGKITIDDHSVDHKEGPYLNFTKVNRLHMGIYLCIASNFVPPTVSRRLSLIVHFAPMITIAHQLVGAALGQDVVLECHSEAFPKSINYWRRSTGEPIVRGSKDPTIEGEKYIMAVLLDNFYKITMKLTIRGVTREDYASYVCLSKNSLGETDGLIKLYTVTPSPSTLAVKTTTLPSSSTNYNTERGRNQPLQLGSSGSNKGKNSSMRTVNSEREFPENTIQSITSGNNNVLTHDNSDEPSSTVKLTPQNLIHFITLFTTSLIIINLRRI